MANIADESTDIFEPELLYREWGKRFVKLDKPQLGIEYFKKSQEHSADNNLWTLLGLCDALKKSGQYNDAADVASQCMKIGKFYKNLIYIYVYKTYTLKIFC